LNKVRSLILKYQDIILYVIFGVLTTVVNFLVYFLFSRIIPVYYIAANAIAWIASVLFAFVTNRIFVFKSEATSRAGIAREFFAFVASRVISGLLETAMLFFGVDVASLPDIPVKIAAAVLVVIINYLFSKYFIFVKRSDGENK